MLVEDNPGDVRLTQEALRESGQNVQLIVQMDGQEAIELLRGKAATPSATLPDLILLDLNLPRTDGREILLYLKTDPVLKRIPVIVLTTSIADQDILICYGAHANCMVSKPVDFDDFFRSIDNILRFWLGTALLPCTR